MSLKTIVVLAIVIVAGAVGDVLVSKGMKQVGEIHSADPASLARVAGRALRQPYVILGALCLAIYFFSFLAVLSWADVSLVVPITSLSFLLTTFLAQWALHERVTPLRWAGTLLIVTGVALVALRGTAEDTGPQAAVTVAHVVHPEDGSDRR
jgi:drug/metabolite transporter (DMT)-like permease